MTHSSLSACEKYFCIVLDIISNINEYGQLGNGKGGDSYDKNSTPTPVLEITGEIPATRATQISAGYSHTCAVLEDKTVKCWGNNRWGQLGDGNGGKFGDKSLTPVSVKTLTNATQVSADNEHTCAVLLGGAMKCWGGNDDRQLGNGAGGNYGNNSLTPTQVLEITGETPATSATQISTGGNYIEGHTCAVLENRTVKCWGANYYGQLGDGTNIERSTPVEVFNINNAKQVIAAVTHTCAVLENEVVKCWGSNRRGQLGNNGPKLYQRIPVLTSGITGETPETSAVQISAGFNHSCAVLVNKTAKCWGENNSRQLGNGNYKGQPTPVSVLETIRGRPLANITQVSAGHKQACALLENGTVKCWGSNYWEHLRTEEENPRVPALVKGINNAKQISTGRNHSCAVLDDGDGSPGGPVKCWGNNGFSQHGDGTINNAVKVSAGYQHTCALLEDKTVRCWGRTQYGELGNDPDANSVFVSLNEINITDGATQISASSNYNGGHTCALLESKRVKCWGRNDRHQLGFGMPYERLTPVYVQFSGN